MENIFSNGLIEGLIEIKDHHARSTSIYKALNTICIEYFKNTPFSEAEPHPVAFGPFGDLVMPYQKMGAVDTLDLFGVDELLIFSFYWANRNRYKKAIDIGANVGLHSILLAKLGIEVTCYEPDNHHFEWLSRRLELNNVTDKVTANKAAISNQDGQLEFIRVEGNSMSSHLAGAKSNPYGDLEKYKVDVHDIARVGKDVDFMKIDAEGHEFEIISAIPDEIWQKADAMVEIGTPENAKQFFDYFESKPVNLFSQKANWAKVESLEGVPTSYKEGSLFLSSKEAMPW